MNPAASSSRSQVAVRSASPVAALNCESPSVSVRWCPLLVPPAVTHLVTRSLRACVSLARLTFRSGDTGKRILISGSGRSLIPARPPASACVYWGCCTRLLYRCSSPAALGGGPAHHLVGVRDGV